MNEVEIVEAEVEKPTTGRAKPLGRPAPAASAQSSPESSLWLPAVALLLIGGIIGFVIGRETTGQPRAETAAVAPTPAIAVGANSSGAAYSSASLQPTPATISPETLRVLGNPNAPVTIVEFSDYQCPFCRRHFLEVFPRLKADYIDTGRVYYVFKDFPIASLHPLAYRLHEAALCAGQSGGPEAYWQAHDLFFSKVETFQAESVAELDVVILAQLASAGLPDVGDCLEKNQNADTVQAGLAEGQRLGVTGTPTFFVNGYPVNGAQSYQVFQQVIAMAEEGRLGEAYSQAANTNAGQTQAGAGQPVGVPLGDAPALGSPDAPITIVEYSDYQCPFCLRHFQNTLPQLQAEIDAGRVRYVFKDFPLHSIHPQAQKAHEGARCARELGGDEAFWTMHDLLFASQAQWAGNGDHVSVIKSLAAEAGLPQDEFDACLDSGRYAAAVNADVAEGQQLGITGTPTFFINGQRLVGAQPFSVFQQYLAALAPAE
ncbi:MAG: DsbA family protein [Chloroflexi bacterium]|nr:DsbA family protein [Chloroflexota bacterium]